MFFKILRKDLKRKRGMNILLVLIVILTAMLLGTSITMLTTVSTATTEFIKKSKMTDFVAVTYTDPDTERSLKEWIAGNPIIKDCYMEQNVILTSNMLTVPENCKKFEYDNMLGMERIPKDCNLAFDENDEPLALGDGEIAIPYLMKEKTGMKIGDTLKISAYGVKKEFRVAHFEKDAYTGSSLFGFKRIFVSDKDYQDFNRDDSSKINNVCINVADGHEVSELEKEFGMLKVNSLVTITRPMYGMLYMMENMVAAIMGIVSLFLIIIAFIILRFTILFTIQEDYKQIGIMKAIGLKDHAVQSVYMVKYFMISLAGGAAGYLLSIPLGKCLIGICCEAMVVSNNSYFNWASILSVSLVILLTILFCRRCTGKIKKVSVMEAIRNGGTGERFKSLSRISLHKRGKMGTSSFLAAADITNHFRRYGVLLVTFVLGTMILLIPINIINTFNDKSAMRLFGQAPIDVLVTPNNATDILYTYSMDQLKEVKDKAQREYREAGIPVELYLNTTYTSKVYKEDPYDSKTIYTNISYGIDSSEYVMEEGSTPELANEVAVSKQVAAYFNASVGDTLHIYVSNREGDFIVTGIYESMINMGESIRFGEKMALPMEGCTGFDIFGRYTKAVDSKAVQEEMQKVDASYKVKDGMAYVNAMLGSAVSILEALRSAILVIILIINFLITMLMVRMMLAKEASEVAILKSIGFKNRTIRAWQVKRMAYILVISVLLGTLLVAAFGGDIAMIVFRMIGMTKVSLVIRPFEVFLMYPGIILADIAAAVLLSTLDIRKIKVWEVNNQE